MNTTNEWGPLPKSGKTNLSERNSVVALHKAFPCEKFRLRPIEGDDTGVDWTIEALDGQFDTNCFAQVQLKSADKFFANKDNSVSYEVSTANLNYLRNGVCPLYILWISETDELRFVWVKDIIRNLECVNPDWTKQRDISIRFYEKITGETLQHIHQRMIGESRMCRNIREMVCRSPDKNAICAINTDSLNVTDATSAKAVLLNSGIGLVSAGYPEIVNRLYDIVDFDSKNNPQLLLAKAYADIEIGRYDLARGALRSAMARRDELSDQGQIHLDWFFNFCEHLLGNRTTKEYLSEFEAINGRQKGDAKLKDALNIEYSKYANITSISEQPRYSKEWNTERTEIFNRIAEIATQIKEHPQCSEYLKAHAAAILLSVDGQEMVFDFTKILLSFGISFHAGQLPENKDLHRLLEYLERFTKWQINAHCAVEKSIALNDQFLYCDTVALFSNVVVSAYLALLSSPFADTWQQIDKSFLSLLLFYCNHLKAVIKNYKRANRQEKWIRAALVMMDMHEIMGEPEKSIGFAREHLPLVKAMCDSSVVQMYEMHLQQKTFLARLLEKNKEDSIFLADCSEQELHEMASMLAPKYGVAETSAYKELLAQQKLAVERMACCKHLQLLVAPQYPTDGPVKYSVVCDFHGYGNSIVVQSQDYQREFEYFTNAYCSTCAERAVF